jgi:hypothetical protein
MNADASSVNTKELIILTGGVICLRKFSQIVKNINQAVYNKKMQLTLPAPVNLHSTRF